MKITALTKLRAALLANAPIWRAAALRRKLFSSLSTSNSANNMIPCLLAHVWVGSNSQLSRLGLIQKGCLKRSSNSSNSSQADRLDECCQSIAQLCGRSLLPHCRQKHHLPSHHRKRCWTSPARVGRAQAGWHLSHGKGSFQQGAIGSEH